MRAGLDGARYGDVGKRGEVVDGVTLLFKRAAKGSVADAALTFTVLFSRSRTISWGRASKRMCVPSVSATVLNECREPKALIRVAWATSSRSSSTDAGRWMPADEYSRFPAQFFIEFFPFEYMLAPAIVNVHN